MLGMRAAGQTRQILGRGVHGLLLCQAESADAARAFVESCRYPHQRAGVDPVLPTPLDRMRGTVIGQTGSPRGRGPRGRGSEGSAAAVWGISELDYFRRCDPWPLNPAGELLLGVKLESPEGIARREEILAVPGLGFAELGPGDLGLALGYAEVQRFPYPPEMRAARERVLAACRRNGVAFLEAATPETVAARIDEGVRVVAGGREDTARAGRARQRRALQV